ncbi:MAG: hypothetical protein JO316_03405 [Abitibacteriaceae bacterium]|nr:hypothetical protein [Abditibacteriaceae bacterium]
MKRCAFVLLTAILFAFSSACCPALAQTPYTGQAVGNLVVDGKPIALHCAYVVEVNNVEEKGLLMAGPQKYYVIVLSDIALPRSSVSDRNAPLSERHSLVEAFAPMSQSAAGKMHGILLKLEPGKKVPFQAQLFYPGVDVGFTVVGTQYPDRVEGSKHEGNLLSGKAILTPAQNTGLEKGPKKYQYSATFSAPILAESAVTQQLEGREALDSPPVQVIREYLVAGKKGDVETLRRLTAASHQTYLSNKEFLKSLRSGDQDKLVEQVKRVVVRGDKATVVVVNEKPNYSQTMMQLVREQGTWHLYWP